MALSYEFFGEIRNHTFRSTIQLRRNTFIKRRNLGDSHENKFSFCAVE